MNKLRAVDDKKNKGLDLNKEKKLEGGECRETGISTTQPDWEERYFLGQ